MTRPRTRSPERLWPQLLQMTFNPGTDLPFFSLMGIWLWSGASNLNAEIHAAIFLARTSGSSLFFTADLSLLLTSFRAGRLDYRVQR